MFSEFGDAGAVDDLQRTQASWIAGKIRSQRSILEYLKALPNQSINLVTEYSFLKDVGNSKTRSNTLDTKSGR